MAGAQQNLTIMTLNLGGVVQDMYRDKFKKMTDEVNIALLQEFPTKLDVNDHFEKLDCYREGRPKTNLCILISRNFFKNFDRQDEFYFDGIEHTKTTKTKKQETVVKYSYMYCCLRLKKTSYFIVNLHIKEEKHATTENLIKLQEDLKAKSSQFFNDDTTFRWIIGGDFNFINRFEDGEAESSLKWWRHYFIDTLPAKDIYPRSTRQEEKYTHGNRRIDRLYLDKRLLNCIVSVRTGDEKLKDHRPVYCKITLKKDGTEEVKVCHPDREKVRCSTCCLWVCRECCGSPKTISSKRHESRMTPNDDWTFNDPARDGQIDGSAEETVNVHTGGLNDTQLQIYSCQSCNKRRTDIEDLKRKKEDLEKKCEDQEKKIEDLEKKCEDLAKENEDLKKMRSADPEE